MDENLKITSMFKNQSVSVVKFHYFTKVIYFKLSFWWIDFDPVLMTEFVRSFLHETHSFWYHHNSTRLLNRSPIFTFLKFSFLSFFISKTDNNIADINYTVFSATKNLCLIHDVVFKSKVGKLVFLNLCVKNEYNSDVERTIN